MRISLSLCILFIFNAVAGCANDAYDDTLLKRLEKRLPKYNADKVRNKNIPSYSNSNDIPIYENMPQYAPTNKSQANKYPTYDSEADNPVYPHPENYNNYGQQAPVNQYQYPTYDSEADNPYYSGQAYDSFDSRVYDDYYPTYNSEADNPVYPHPDNYNNYGQQAPANQYQYPTYDSEADNPVVPSAPANTLFDSPSFDGPVFDN